MNKKYFKKSCAVSGCSNNDLLTPGESFFKFPTDCLVKKKWMSLTGTKQSVYYKSIPESDRPKEGPIDTVKYPPSIGLTVEFCAGIVDKNKALEEIAVDEVREECGYEVKVSDMEKIISCRAALSTAGSIMTFFYTEVTDQMKVSEGGGLANEGEDIEVVEYTIPQIRDIITQSEVLNGSSSFLFGLMWFLTNKIVLNN
ncbi:hypothetical protein ACI65C_007667 [Semiaphis heraclei]